MSKYKLNKKCKKCGARLLDKNKTGFCNHHRDRTGKNNSFYGKRHTKESIDKMKIKTSIVSKEKWQEPEYRKKVIKGISKPRRKGFKKEQSERIKQWYKDNPEQKEIRKKKMKESWTKGLIVKNGYSCNSSKLEKELFNEIKKIAPSAKRKQTIRDMNNRWIFPDILIEDWGTIIEFYGNYWHANPKFYKENDMILNYKAKDIWKKDKERINRLRNIPDGRFPKEYNVIIVWQDDYQKDKELILSEINASLNYEYSY